MDIKTRKKNEILIISLTGELNIYSANQVKNTLLPLLDDSKKIAVDLKRVSEVDTAGMQVLIFLKQQSKVNNVKFKLVNHSEAVIKVLSLLGLVSFFADQIKLTTELKEKYSFDYGV